MKASDITNVLRKKSLSSLSFAFYWSLDTPHMINGEIVLVPVAVSAYYSCFIVIVIVFIVVNVLEIHLFEVQKLHDFFLT
jgi:hypothetical protein